MASLMLTPAITGEKARSGFESSAEGTMVDGDVRFLVILITILKLLLVTLYIFLPVEIDP